MTAREPWFAALRERLDAHDPRPFIRCATCLDFGMVEDFSGREDACPTCEGGIWRERMPWRRWIERLDVLGFRVGFWGERRWLPTIYRSTAP